ncbi:MAG: hypothetical protein OSJ72_19395 [Lachnospiraceae bacterium]|nr:hypothetical protein [Lachnospiraceae bacterium]
MANRLTSLIHLNKERLLELNISVDRIESSELDFRDEAEQVDLFNETAFARITLFESNRLYIQILNIKNESTIYFFDDILDNEEDIDEFIMQAIYKMNG